MSIFLMVLIWFVIAVCIVAAVAMQWRRFERDKIGWRNTTSNFPVLEKSDRAFLDWLDEQEAAHEKTKADLQKVIKRPGF
jgi:hypothetical protein